MKYAYTAVLIPAEEGGYNVEFPDLPGCFTCGDSLTEALEMAKDAAEMLLASYEDDGDPIPEGLSLKDIKTDLKKDGIAALVLADTDEWRKKSNNRAVKKTLSIPSWLNYKAEKAGVNFSQVLQDALKAMLA